MLEKKSMEENRDLREVRVKPVNETVSKRGQHQYKILITYTIADAEHYQEMILNAKAKLHLIYACTCSSVKKTLKMKGR